MQKINSKLVGAGAFLATLVGVAAPSFAAGATYDISGVTNSVTSDLAANVPTILAVIGGLIALTIAVRMVRKFVKA